MSAQSSQHASHKEGKFAGFISRIKTAAGADGAEGAQGASTGRKVISGPIVRVQQAGDGDGSAAASDNEGAAQGDRMDGLGKTWASLVDEDILRTMNARERKRQEVRTSLHLNTKTVIIR
jgi:hypothetical protein